MVSCNELPLQLHWEEKQIFISSMNLQLILMQRKELLQQKSSKNGSLRQIKPHSWLSMIWLWQPISQISTAHVYLCRFNSLIGSLFLKGSLERNALQIVLNQWSMVWINSFYYWESPSEEIRRISAQKLISLILLKTKSKN